jgi:hypothetical protein
MQNAGDLVLATFASSAGLTRSELEELAIGHLLSSGAC